LINDGFALTFGDAMALEHRISSQMNAALTPSAVEANRHAVLARGRSQ
jgi:enoyl-CoA hydratase